MPSASLSSFLCACSLLLLPLLGGGLSACRSNPVEPASEPELSEPDGSQRLAVEARQQELERIERMATREATLGGPQQAPDKDPSLTQEPDEAADLVLEKKTRELYLAQLELELSEAKASQAQAEAADDLQAAERALSLAQDALQYYRQKSAPRLVAEQALKVDRQVFKVEEATQNLAQMKQEYAIYETDGPAKSTGEIVVWRAETQLDLTQRALKGAQALQLEAVGNAIPLEIEKLTQAQVVAEQGLRKAQEAVARQALENKLSITRAGDKRSYLELELHKLREKQSSL